MDFYTYVDAKEKKAQAWINKASALDRKREALDKSIKQLEKASAGKRGDEKKSAQVASRKKKMERFGADKTEDGTKWKRSTMGERKFSVKDEMRNCRGRDAGMRLLMQQKGTPILHNAAICSSNSNCSWNKVHTTHMHGSEIKRYQARFQRVGMRKVLYCEGHTM
eukprot:m.1079512 g.1079512  ORF g.1079512 m.1079512 type:complete len:165 (-) comp24254_c0_seq71:3718-4212(-)